MHILVLVLFLEVLHELHVRHNASGHFGFPSASLPLALVWSTCSFPSFNHVPGGQLTPFSRLRHGVLPGPRRACGRAVQAGFGGRAGVDTTHWFGSSGFRDFGSCGTQWAWAALSCARQTGRFASGSDSTQ